MKEVKCSECDGWSLNLVNCSHCNFKFNRRVDPETGEIVSSSSRISKPEVPNKLRLFMDRTRASKNPLVKFIYYLVMGVWGIYVGLVVFMLYLAVMASG